MPILMFHAVVAIARLLTPCAFPAALQRIATAMAVLRIYARMTALCAAKSDLLWGHEQCDTFRVF
ncbi:hypothetical protein W59_07709 [Rhodococcus opacus RKJ300 = JCM 13270]|uniref:Secreted protein n=1 Tax=Rhodococcus opacus RKJ300 = JCM 13270 TaxID=1165867 RepID=I0WVU0_RHOOP|nr:hypothetical protein W59_07709 [Rhodococcus opacus RKJ300 = JCM 13270]